MPSNRKGWKVLVIGNITTGRWWLTTLFDKKKRRQGGPVLGSSYDARLRGKAAYQLTEREAKRALSEVKRQGREAKLVNPQGQVIKWVNKP